MKVKPKANEILFTDDWKIAVHLTTQQIWNCIFHEDYIKVMRGNVSLKLNAKEFKEHFKED